MPIRFFSKCRLSRLQSEKKKVLENITALRKAMAGAKVSRWGRPAQLKPKLKEYRERFRKISKKMRELKAKG